MSVSGAHSARLSRPAESYLETVASLSAAQKTVAGGAPPYSVYVNRRAGRYVAAAAYRAGLTPNQVTALSAGFTFTGILLLALAEPRWWVGLLVWMALAIGYIFDSADGQLARLRGGGSVAGEWLDHVVDSTKIVTLHLAVLVLAYRHIPLPAEGWLLIPIGYAIVGTVAFFAMILNDQLKAVVFLKSGLPAAKRGGSAIKSLLLVPTDYGVLCLLFLLLGLPVVFFVGYALFFVANTAHLSLALTRWFGDMKRASETPTATGRS
ncbi:CDP-alcohol phosphatidyltransferase family protein [Arthrobacter oryzae]|uniref:CDP-alcohol phosphatidyltransferase family protein n=1 Tax=Arthrobacter oryzae TaxID=409290 RepID=A0A3N0BV22_9MICC|nr:CDP-alcohol phosphatidyltransferase family protein [Arthrobacter oryzae]RNL53234.1 CDP-alcohol phosphatidyltransferase family protein [Arthrobacter oryzae]